MLFSAAGKSLFKVYFSLPAKSTILNLDLTIIPSSLSLSKYI